MCIHDDLLQIQGDSASIGGGIVLAQYGDRQESED